MSCLVIYRIPSDQPSPSERDTLMGDVFLGDHDRVRYESLHFDEKIGCHVSLQYSDYANENFFDGTAVPS